VRHTQGSPEDAGGVVGRVEWILLGSLLAFTAAAVAGYGTFALHPGLLPDSVVARRVFTVSFELFARVHIALAAVALGGALILRLRLRWLVPFVGVCFLAFLAEHVGTGYGLPFGGYSYSGLLGAKLGGRVPALIPVSWFLMALPAWVMARRALPGPGRKAVRAGLAALWLVAWDLALDPAMSFLTPYWSWQSSGSYYGMPWLNLLGWYGTGLVIMVALEAAERRVGWSALDARWMTAYYGVMLLMPLGMLAVAGAWGAVLTTLGAIAALSAISGALRSRSPRAVSARLPYGAVGA